MVDAGGKGKGAGKFADGALRDPVAVLRLLLLLHLLVLVGGGDLLVVGRGLRGLGARHGGFVFDGGLVVVLAGGLGCIFRGGDTALFLLALDSGGRSAGFAVAFGAALDAQGLGVGELDLDVLLVDSGELAVKLVAVLDLLHIEARLEGTELGDVAKVIALA